MKIIIIVAAIGSVLVLWKIFSWLVWKVEKKIFFRGVYQYLDEGKGKTLKEKRKC